MISSIIVIESQCIHQSEMDDMGTKMYFIEYITGCVHLYYCISEGVRRQLACEKLEFTIQNIVYLGFLTLK